MINSILGRDGRDVGIFKAAKLPCTLKKSGSHRYLICSLYTFVVPGIFAVQIYGEFPIRSKY